jgi:hypothetical protein
MRGRKFFCSALNITAGGMDSHLLDRVAIAGIGGCEPRGSEAADGAAGAAMNSTKPTVLHFQGSRRRR